MPDRDTIIIVPFKDPTGSKKRLAGVLSAEQRREFAIALFDSTLKTLLADGTTDVAVVTGGMEVAERAQRAGAIVIPDEASAGETAAVSMAARWSADRGYARQLVVPGDMAALDAAELRRLLETRLPPPGVVFAPAVGEDGTNAILTSPPDCLPYRFGAASFPEYLARSAALGLHVRVLRLPSFLLDIDTPEDLAAFRAARPGVPATALLDGWGIDRA